MHLIEGLRLPDERQRNIDSSSEHLKWGGNDLLGASTTSKSVKASNIDIEREDCEEYIVLLIWHNF